MEPIDPNKIVIDRVVADAISALGMRVAELERLAKINPFGEVFEHLSATMRTGMTDHYEQIFDKFRERLHRLETSIKPKKPRTKKGK